MRRLTFMGVIASICLVIQGQEYVITGPADTRFIPNYQHNQDFNPFRNNYQHIDSYLPQKDLQTSDLPYHLQQTLPQYRITTKTPPFAYYRSSQPQPFQAIVPSTHRPNYSHLFSHSHNRNPSQTETFLGEITLQSPAELPPQYNDFKPSPFTPSRESIDQNLDFTEKPAVQIGGQRPRANFLNHRSRIFAPDSSKKSTLVKDYFVNDNGDVFISTKTPFVPKPTSSTRPPTTVERRNPFSPTTKPTNKPLAFNVKPNKKPFVPKKGLDLEPLLEEPIRSPSTNSKNDDVVEVVESKVETTTIEEDVTTDYEYDVTEDPLVDYVEDEEINTSKEKLQNVEDTSKEESVKSSEVVTGAKEEEEGNNFKESENEEEVTSSEEKYEQNTASKEEEKNEEDNTSKEEKVEEQQEGVNNSKEERDEQVNNSKEERDEQVNTSKEENGEEKEKQVNSSKTEKEEEKYEQVITSKEEKGEKKDRQVNTPKEKEVNDSKEETTEKDDVEVNTFKTATSEEVPDISKDNKDFSKEDNTSQEEYVNNSAEDNASLEEKSEEQADASTEIQHSESNEELETTTTQPEVVVSVVTTKSVVNNTIIPSATPLPLVTVDLDGENSTDTWVVVASVQTSRSVSGARYLPSSIVEQDERRTLLNEDDVETTTTESETTLPPKIKTSTESLIDKLDRVQSDLSSGLLSGGFHEGNNIAVITEMATTMMDVEVSSKSSLPVVQIRKFSPLARPSSTQRPKKTYQRKPTTPKSVDQFQGDEPPKNGRSTGESNKTVIIQDVSAFLPPGYKNNNKDSDSFSLLASILSKIKPTPEPKNITESMTKDDISSHQNLTTTTEKNTQDLLNTAKQDDISAFLPPGYKTFKTSTASPPKLVETLLAKAKQDNLSSLLPPGYKPTPKAKTDLFASAKPVDVSAFLPPGYKPTPKSKSDLFAEAKPLDVSAFLPPGYKARTTPKPLTTEAEKVPTSLLPPGYKVRDSKDVTSTSTSTSTTTTAKPSGGGGFKVVFPSRPGGGTRKSATRLTTPRASNEEPPRVTPPAIQKGWPSRATTEFTGWPTPSTTPISIEKLLEAARAASTTTTTISETTTTTRTTTTTTTTTTPKPTTPGVCTTECDLAGTIKLIGGAKWAPELLDRNTKEWQLLANEVQVQLEDVFSRSNILNKWYKKIRIDGFSEGSVLVDYLVELNDLGRQIDTIEIKKLFHDSLDDALANPASTREAKALNETTKIEGKLSLGRFIVDPKFTDFIVLPKQAYPTVGYAEDNVLLPQWAIAVIVIGLASLLFVIIFGVTVLVNRQKNAKKKAPVPLTEDMLNELNKNHMGGFDNYGADDLYNMEEVWNERGYEPKLAKKRSSGSIHDNSMSNLYDSWRSEWNGFYYNTYYGNNPGSSHGRRRSDYDMNF